MNSASVIIAARNAAPWIRRCVRSVLDQQGLDFLELILVDDGSTDDTAALALAEAAGDPRLCLLRNDVNIGPAASRNRALAQARGDWLAFFDADDWFLPGRLQRVLAAGREAGADVVADDFLYVMDGESRPWRSYFPADWPPASPYLLTVREFIDRSPPEAVDGLGLLKPVVRRALMERAQLRQREDVRIGEDFFFVLDLLAAGARLVLVREPLFCYTTRPDSLTHTRRLEDLVKMAQVHDRLLASPVIRANPPLHAQLAARAHRLRGRQIPVYRIALALKERRWGEALAGLLARPWLLGAVLARGIVYWRTRRRPAAAGGGG